MNYQKLIFSILGTRPIAFNPIFAKITSSITAGLFLSQLIYWQGKEIKDQEGWVFKTIKEFEEETALSRYEQETAIKKLKRLKIIEVKVKGVPPKRYFKINFDILFNLLKNNKSICGNPTNQFVEIQQINTDNTTDITTDIKKKENIKERKEEKKEASLKEEKIKKEYQESVDHFNACFRRRFKAIDGNLKNFTYWRELYNLQEIKDAIKIATTDNFWYNKLTPTILFRRKNPQGEPVDYIGSFLNKKRAYDLKKQLATQDGKKKEEESFKPISWEKVKELRSKINQLSRIKSF